MARICINQKWYEQVEPSTFSEQVFEDRISLHAPSIYPYYYVVPFKKPLLTPDETKESGFSRVIADLAFISKDYKEWWVVEVEMGYHQFAGHILPQVKKLKTAEYGIDVAEYLANQSGELDLKKLIDLINNTPVQVLLVINQHKPDWAKELSKIKVLMAVFELFRADDEDEIFRVNGEYPAILTDEISACVFHPTIPRLLEVKNPEKLHLPKRAIVKLLYNNCTTEWRRIDEGNQVWLTSTNRNPLDAECQYVIYRQNDGQLVLKLVNTPK